MNNRKKYLTFVIIVIALLVVFGFFAKDSKFDFPKTGVLSETNINYENRSYGLSFKYPSKYTIDEREVVGQERDHHTITLLPKDYKAPEGGEGPATITIEIYQNNLDNLSLEQWVTTTADSNFKLSNGAFIPTKVDGENAITYEWDGLYRARTTALIHNANIIAVTGSYNDPEDEIVKDYENVLSTIKLTPQSTSGKLPQTLVENYIKENISNLSDVKEVLGGKFYVTNVTLTQSGKGNTTFEDGHNSFVADFNYAITPDGRVEISNFITRK